MIDPRELTTAWDNYVNLVTHQTKIQWSGKGTAGITHDCPEASGHQSRVNLVMNQSVHALQATCY
jgi:hypothetical protein